MKKVIKNRNIYIYKICVIITLLVMGFLCLAAFLAASLCRDKNTDVATEYVFTPEKTNDRIIMFGLHDGDRLESIAVIKLSPIRKEILCVPVALSCVAKVNATTASLEDIYNSGGGDALAKGVGNCLCVDIERYLIMDHAYFNKFVNLCGGISMFLPCDLDYKNPNNGEVTCFIANSMKTIYNGDDIRKIMTYPLYEKGELKNCEVIGDALVSLINNATNFKDNIIQNMDNIAFDFIKNSITNITTYDYNNAKKSYRYLIEEASSPATYFLIDAQNNNGKSLIVNDDCRNKLSKYLYLG